MVDKVLDVKSGLKAALADEVRADAPVPGSDAAAEQLSLLPDMPLCEIAGGAASAENEYSAPRGRGRPAGAKNKNTEEWRNYLLSRYRSPLEVLAETYSRSIIQLAADLGYLVRDEKGRITRTPKPDELEGLLKIQLQCAKELAPYVHQKQPMAIDAGENGLMQLIINTGAATAEQVENAGVFNLDFIDVEDEEKQGFSDNEKFDSVVSDSVVSDETAENSAIEGCSNADTISVACDDVVDPDQGGGG